MLAQAMLPEGVVDQPFGAGGVGSPPASLYAKRYRVRIRLVGVALMVL